MGDHGGDEFYVVSDSETKGGPGCATGGVWGAIGLLVFALLFGALLVYLQFLGRLW